MRKSLNFEVKEEAEELGKLLKGSKDSLQHARLQALYLYKTDQCRYRKDIAEKIGYGRNAVGRWLQVYERKGLSAMLSTGASGNPRGVGIPAEVMAALQERLQDPYQDIKNFHYQLGLGGPASTLPKTHWIAHYCKKGKN